MEIKKKIFFITDVGDGFVNIDGETSLLNIQFLKEKYYNNSIEYGLLKNMKFNEFLSFINKKISDKNSVLALHYDSGILHLEYQRLLNDFDLITESIDFYFRDKNNNYFNDFNSEIFVKKINLLIDIYKECESETICNALSFQKEIEERNSMKEYFFAIYDNYVSTNEWCFDNIPFSIDSFINFCIKYGPSLVKDKYGHFRSFSKTNKVVYSLLTGCTSVAAATSIFSSFFDSNLLLNGTITMIGASCSAFIFSKFFSEYINNSNIVFYNKLICEIKKKYFILPDFDEENLPKLKG